MNRICRDAFVFVVLPFSPSVIVTDRFTPVVSTVFDGFDHFGGRGIGNDGAVFGVDGSISGPFSVGYLDDTEDGANPREGVVPALTPPPIDISDVVATVFERLE